MIDQEPSPEFIARFAEFAGVDRVALDVVIREMLRAAVAVENHQESECRSLFQKFYDEEIPGLTAAEMRQCFDHARALFRKHRDEERRRAQEPRP